jgi:hypothetical protein
MSFGDCQSHSVREGRIRAEVIPPIEALLGKFSQEDVRAAVRAELVRQQEDTKAIDQVTKMGAVETLERMEKRMQTWLEMVGDGEMSREQYAKLRAEYEPQIKELQAQLAARPHLALPDMEQFFAIADALEGVPPDDGEWREIIEGVLDRVVIEGHAIRVVWQEWFKPLLALGTER